MFEVHGVTRIIPKVELRGLEMLRSLKLRRPWRLDLQSSNSLSHQ